jgi:hypothetical protein
MEFDDALSVLLGWLGEEVQVTLRGAGGMEPVMAAELFGKLSTGDELREGGTGPANSLMFVLDASPFEEESSTFIVAKDAFLGARWFDDDEEVLAINCGVIQFLICLAEI